MNRFAFVLLMTGLGGLLYVGPARAVEPQQRKAAETSGKQASDEPIEGGDDEQSVSVWMEKKLEHSQAILRGLAMADFDSVAYNAQRLKLLNRVEGFVRRRNPEYRAQLHTFSRVVAEIERQADKENIEGATLAFNQLTVSCVECHKSLRSNGIGLSDDSNETDAADSSGRE